MLPRTTMSRMILPAVLVITTTSAFAKNTLPVAASSQITESLKQSSLDPSFRHSKSQRNSNIRRRAEQDEGANDSQNMYYYSDNQNMYYYTDYNSNNEGNEGNDDSIFATGYIQPTGCASYTISLGDEGYDELYPGISVVGQETVLFFEYVLSLSDSNNDDANSGYDDYFSGYNSNGNSNMYYSYGSDYKYNGEQSENGDDNYVEASDDNVNEDQNANGDDNYANAADDNYDADQDQNANGDDNYANAVDDYYNYDQDQNADGDDNYADASDDSVQEGQDQNDNGVDDYYANPSDDKVYEEKADYIDDYYAYPGDDDTNRNRRNLGNSNYNDDAYQSYGHNYTSNAVLAKDWLTIFSLGELSGGCVKMVDPTTVFEDVVPSIEDGSLSFPTLYYGPVCASDSTSFEMGVFLDSNCNAYVPGLSEILKKYVMKRLTREVSLRGETNSSSSSGYNGGDLEEDGYKYTPYHQIHYDIQNLGSYETIINKFNYYHNRDVMDCGVHSEICQYVSEASVDLNTCQSLAEELEQEEKGDYDYDEQVNNGNADYANNYGSIFVKDKTRSGKEEATEYYYQMYQWVAKKFAYYTTSGEDDKSYKGFCYGLLESSSMGITLDEWLDTNAKALRHELEFVYGVNNTWAEFCFTAGIVAASVGLLLLLLEACGCSVLETLLPISRCSCRKKRRLSGSTASTDGSSKNMFKFTPEKLGKRNGNSLLDDDSKSTALLELSPTYLSLSSASSSSSSSASSRSFQLTPQKLQLTPEKEERILESVEVVFQKQQKNHPTERLPPPEY